MPYVLHSRFLHFLDARKMQMADMGETCLQKGHMAMTCSHSGEHLHLIASFTMHSQQMVCRQQEVLTRLPLHCSARHDFL